MGTTADNADTGRVLSRGAGPPRQFVGQAENEFTVNEAIALTDALLHCAIEDEANDPPPPRCDGLRVLNRATGQDIRLPGAAWLAPTAPAGPSGGTTIDTQPRAAIAALIDQLVEAGTPQAP